jgi:hypothetical protein
MESARAACGVAAASMRLIMGARERVHYDARRTPP